MNEMILTPIIVFGQRLYKLEQNSYLVVFKTFYALCDAVNAWGLRIILVRGRDHLSLQFQFSSLFKL